MASKHTCSICLNNFTIPKFLPCHHTFCEECIDDIIKAGAHFKKFFNCPVCRRKIRVPKRGASQFVTNFYLEDDDDDKLYCIKHKKEEIKVYCRDCCKPCCSVCVMVGHENHTKADLGDIEREVRDKFLKLKTESEKKIKQLQKHSDFLKTKICDLDKSCKTASDNVQKQIDNICEKARKIGGTINDDIHKIGEYENSRLAELVEFSDMMASKMIEWCEYSDHMLQHRSIITAVDKHGLRDVQTKTDFNISPHLDTPVVRHPQYSMVEVDVYRLKLLLGEVPTYERKPVQRILGDVQTPITFTSRVSLNQVKPDELYFSDDVIIHGLKCYVSVMRIARKSKLFIRLEMKKVEDKNIKTGFEEDGESVECAEASYTVKLLNINDESKSLVKQCADGVFVTSYDTVSSIDDSVHDVAIDWGKLEELKNGFINKNKIFTVQTTVQITDIYDTLLMKMTDAVYFDANTLTSMIKS